MIPEQDTQGRNTSVHRNEQIAARINMIQWKMSTLFPFIFANRQVKCNIAHRTDNRKFRTQTTLAPFLSLGRLAAANQWLASIIKCIRCVVYLSGDEIARSRDRASQTLDPVRPSRSHAPCPSTRTLDDGSRGLNTHRNNSLVNSRIRCSYCNDMITSKFNFWNKRDVKL